MKRYLVLLLSLLIAITAMTSCSAVTDGLGDVLGNIPGLDAILGDGQTGGEEVPGEGEKPNDTEKPGEGEKPNDTEKPGEGEKPNDTEKPDDGDNNGEGGSSVQYKNTDFTPAERELFMTYIGQLIPFLPNDEYYVEGYYEETDYENGLCFYTVGNTEADFAAYRALLADYTLTDTYEDEEGDTWYTYEKDKLIVDLVGYEYDGEYWINVFVCVEENHEGDSGADDDEGEDTDSDYIHTAFDADDRELFMTYIGLVIPFAPCDEYYIEGYYEEYDYENGLNYYTLGNTQADFDAYRALFSAYTLTDTYEDDYGDTWYTYVKGDVVVDLGYYYYEDEYWIDVFVYSETLSSDGDWDDEGGNDHEGGNGDQGGNGDSDIELLPNDGKGLPTDSDGVHDVDFTKGENVKDVTDQGYYEDGMPTVGSPAVLVIPVDFSDRTAASLGYSLDKLRLAFLGATGTTDAYSVYEYYSISSYGALDLDITVLDFWFRPANKSTYYENATMDYFDSEVMIGDQLILHEALSYLEDIMDLSQFDSDNNGYIDSVVLIQTLDIGEDDFHWAYRYWNIYTDSNDEYYKYDGVSANDYLWASYRFMHEGTDRSGNVTYDNTDAINTYTYIHEFGHVLGADDYYDTAYKAEPMGGYDVMDGMLGDHNAYTKFNLGWITDSRLVVTESTLTLSLDAFAKNGDTILLATDWDDTLGAYQEYFIIVYYTNTGLNGGDLGYFERDGILVYHVNATLYREQQDGKVYYDVYNNNTDASSESGTQNNLLEYVLTGDGDYTYTVGDALGTVYNDSGDALGYTFTVDAIDGESATLTFTKK